MSVRLLEMRRVLKDTGSIYLHCDPTASHYLKLLMDGIFGHKRPFQVPGMKLFGIIITDGPERPKAGNFQRKHDS